MRHFLLAVVLLAALSGARGDDPPKPAPVTREAVQKAIATFRAEPTTDEGRTAGALIVRFVEESSEVTVVISRRNMPWYSGQSSSKYDPLLMTAYSAGSVRAQLESGVMKDDPRAGNKQVIETYKQLKTADANLRLPMLEKMTEMAASEQALKNYKQFKATDSNRRPTVPQGAASSKELPGPKESPKPTVEPERREEPAPTAAPAPPSGR